MIVIKSWLVKKGSSHVGIPTKYNKLGEYSLHFQQPKKRLFAILADCFNVIMNTDDNNESLNKKANTKNKEPVRWEPPLNITKIGEYSLRLIFLF